MPGPTDLLPLVFVREHLRSWLDRAESSAFGMSNQLERSLATACGFQRSVALLREMLGGLIDLNENPGAPSLELARLFFSEYAANLFHREHGVSVVSDGIAAREVVRVLVQHFESLVSLLSSNSHPDRVSNLTEARAACALFPSLNVSFLLRSFGVSLMPPDT